MYRNALKWGAYVAPHKGAISAQLFGWSIQIDLCVGQVAPSFRGIDQHSTNAAIHINKVVGLCATGVERQLIQLFTMFA